MRFSVFHRGDFGVFFKYGSKVIRIVKSHLIGDFGNGKVGFYE